MATAYTPGLLVTGRTTIRKVRRLPLPGEVRVTVGQSVTSDQVVAHADLPGALTALRAAEKLGINPDELRQLLHVQEGDRVQKGDILAETKGMFGLFGNRLTSPLTGKLEYISPATGTIGLREDPLPLNLTAYLAGTIERVLPGEGVEIVAQGALVQGIFGVGGERHGILKTVAAGSDSPLDENLLDASCAGKILLGGATVNVAQLRRAAECGVLGLIVGAVNDAVLRAYLGYDIGVAITGQEDVPITLILTEGFGRIDMASRTFQLLDSLQGKDAVINGATQIRAGVIRPEIIVPITGAVEEQTTHDKSELLLGGHVRLIREPYFGQFATITALPPELREIATGAKVRIAEVQLDDGTTALVPRANVELLQK